MTQKSDKIWAAWCVATYHLLHDCGVKKEDYEYIIGRMMDAIKMKTLLNKFDDMNKKS
jgi:hypothetical protein